MLAALQSDSNLPSNGVGMKYAYFIIQFQTLFKNQFLYINQYM